MRLARLKYKQTDCYYHLINRTACMPDQYLLGDEEKSQMLYLIRRLTGYFTVEVLSYCIMSNHFHIVCFASGKSLDNKEVCARYNRFYKGKKAPINPQQKAVCRREAERMRDISAFMSQFQHQFTAWFNRKYERKGRLWMDRFKSVILEGETAVRSCIRYVELNPVRAGLVKNPEDYKFSSWGFWHSTGKHPYAANFYQHIKRFYGEQAKDWSIDDLRIDFQNRMMRLIRLEKERFLVKKKMEDLENENQPEVYFSKRSRYWSNGLILGTEAFIRSTSGDFYGNQKAEKKKLDRTLNAEKEELFSYRQLRVNM